MLVGQLRNKFPLEIARIEDATLHRCPFISHRLNALIRVFFAYYYFTRFLVHLYPTLAIKGLLVRTVIQRCNTPIILEVVMEASMHKGGAFPYRRLS